MLDRLMAVEEKPSSSIFLPTSPLADINSRRERNSGCLLDAIRIWRPGALGADRRSCSVRGHASTRTTEMVYRRELRPVLTTGAEIMDELFTGTSPPSAREPLTTGTSQPPISGYLTGTRYLGARGRRPSSRSGRRSRIVTTRQPPPAPCRFGTGLCLSPCGRGDHGTPQYWLGSALLMALANGGLCS
jgi:hypothetical protein